MITQKRKLADCPSVSKGKLPMLSQLQQPTVILGHLIISPPQSPQLDASYQPSPITVMQLEPPGLRLAASLHH